MARPFELDQSRAHGRGAIANRYRARSVYGKRTARCVRAAANVHTCVCTADAARSSSFPKHESPLRLLFWACGCQISRLGSKCGGRKRAQPEMCSRWGPRVERKEHAYYAIRPLLVAAVGPPPVQVALQRLRSFAKEDRPRHRPLEESSRRLDTSSLGIGSATDHLKRIWQTHIVAETPRGLT